MIDHFFLSCSRRRALNGVAGHPFDVQFSFHCTLSNQAMLWRPPLLPVTLPLLRLDEVQAHLKRFLFGGWTWLACKSALSYSFRLFPSQEVGILLPCEEALFGGEWGDGFTAFFPLL